MTRFQACLAFVWEQANDGAKDDSAPGENFATSYGITQMTWDSAVASGIVSGPLSGATRDDCAAILFVRYWRAAACDYMAPGCDLMVFNDGMVCGVGHVSRLVQRIVGVPVDGVIGPVTLRGIKSMGAGRFINAMAKADDEYYASLAKAPLFLRGWTRREAEARALALKMAGIPDARS